MPTKRTGAGERVTPGEIVDDLNRLMAEEAEACLRYFQMRYRLTNKDYAAAEHLFDEAIRETLEHAAALAAHTKALGHIPTLRIDLTLSGGPIRLEAALAEALDVEQQALDAYRDLLPRVAGDARLEAFVRQQIQVETEHVEEMRAFAQTHATVTLVPRKAATKKRGRDAHAR